MERSMNLTDLEKTTVVETPNISHEAVRARAQKVLDLIDAMEEAFLDNKNKDQKVVDEYYIMAIMAGLIDTEREAWREGHTVGIQVGREEVIKENFANEAKLSLIRERIIQALRHTKECQAEGTNLMLRNILKDMEDLTFQPNNHEESKITNQD